MVEFSLTLPLFGALLFGSVEAGLMLWTQLGLQHGVEVAARCATVDKTACGSASQIQSVAAREAYGLGVGPETFSFSATTCGNEVSANYSYRFIAGRIAFAAFNAPAVGISARSCFPKP